MKAAIVKEPGMLSLENIPEISEITTYQCRVKNLYASACTGTDQKIIHNKLPWGSSYPAVLGHETVGEITEIGSQVQNFNIDDIVLRPVYVYAGEKRNGFSSEFGGFSEYGVITDWKAMQADGCQPENWSAYSRYQMSIPRSWKGKPESVLLITMKETFSWIKALGPFFGKRVAVIGCGAVGLFYMKFAAMMCASEVVAVARSVRYKELALNRGADVFVELGKGEQVDGQFDVLIDAAGIIDCINDFTGWVKPSGTFAVYGVGGKMNANINAFGSGLNFAFHAPAEDDELIHDTCIKLVEKGIIDLHDFHSSVMPFEEIVEGFKLIEQRKEFKPIFQL